MVAGAIQSLSMRGLTEFLLAHLSAESRRRLAELFRFSLEGDEDMDANRFRSLVQLQA